MSHESFRRPGPDSDAASASTPRAADHLAEVEVVHETAVAGTSRRNGSPDLPSRDFKIPATVIVGVAALIVGAVGGALLIYEPVPQPVPITVDSFPREILEKERDDIRLRENGTRPDLVRLDAQFEDQLNGYRQAYGGEGATLTYKGFSLTILNGRLATSVPLQPYPASADVTWMVSLRTENTLCVSLDPPSVEVLDEPIDDTKDVFYFLERGRFDATTECVLVDEDRNISLRLVGSGWRKRTTQSAEALHKELVALHASLLDEVP